MLRFEAFRNGQPASEVNLAGAYVFGQDQVPVRADLTAEDGAILCAKRSPGAAGLALLWHAEGDGEMLLPTTRLPERNRPYNLNLELARARVMLIDQKREDWGLIDYSEAEQFTEELEAVRRLFIDALKMDADDRPAAATLADACLARGLALAERIALFHASIFLARRRKTVAAKPVLGCAVDLFSHSDAFRGRVNDVCEFVRVPLPWKHIEPKERNTQYGEIDVWTEWAVRSKVPVHAGPVLSFEPQFIPEWLYIWEHDFETLREMIYDYVGRITERYKGRVSQWIVCSGLHAYNDFNLSFEQIMELTRMGCALVKKASPRATALIDLQLPWGEYYARNPRTVPPLMYADMCVQSGVKFDGFGVQLYMGAASDGLFVRDLMQLSDLLDEFAAFGKPLHVTACQVPSNTTPDRWDGFRGQGKPDQAGQWHGPWTPELQAQWLAAFYQVALSKPYVETVCWRDLADYEGHYMPHGGLCASDLAPKPAFESLRRLRASLSRPAAARQRRAATRTKPE